MDPLYQEPPLSRLVTRPTTGMERRDAAGKSRPRYRASRCHRPPDPRPTSETMNDIDPDDEALLAELRRVAALADPVPPCPRRRPALPASAGTDAPPAPVFVARTRRTATDRPKPLPCPHRPSPPA
ncbi:hypothetical protein GCM10022255_016390 [Dactylosporangium darangshiense]|uniref:Uncharacterized protein n=1 Tax=Dactylosporangium darangshiense TaxID=579108 RepID=A0ABP8D1X6_9ACTN